jgi:DNA processing protein
MSTTALTHIIAAALSYKGIGPGWINKHREILPDIDTLVSLLHRDAVREAEPPSPRQFRELLVRIEQEHSKLLSTIDRVISFDDPLFPYIRGTVKDGDRPVLLYYRGDIRLMQKGNPNVAVIGHLNPDIGTTRFETVVVDALIERGYTIVSGLAQGCDAIAHQQAVLRRSKTIAVLPSTVDSVIPTQHRALADQIVEHGGLLISEYGSNAHSRMEQVSRFVTRDRLQAAFSDGVLLVASYAEADKGFDSGSRHAMAKAKLYGIPRAVLYDASQNNNDPAYNLNRQLQLTDTVTTITPSNIPAALVSFLSTQKNTPDSNVLEQTSMF